MSATLRRRWGPFDWVIALAGVLVAAAAFVGLLVYDRVLFCIALSVVTTNVLTWRVTRTAMRAEAEAARTRLDALDLTPAGGQPPVPDQRRRLVDPSEAASDLDHVELWRTLDGIARRLD